MTGVCFSNSERRRGYLHTRWMGFPVSCDFQNQLAGFTLTRRSASVRALLEWSSRLSVEPRDEARTSSPFWYDAQPGIVRGAAATSLIINSYFAPYSS